MQLHEDARHVRLHGGLAHDQLGGDLRVRHPARDQLEDLVLARRQLVELLRRRAVDGRVRGELLDQPARDRRGQQRLALRHDVDAGNELVGGHVLEEEAAGAGAQGLVDVLVQVERGEHQHARGVLARRVVHDLARGFEPVQPRHADVHQRHVRPQLADHLHGLLPVLGLAHDLDLGLGLQDHLEAGAHERLVISDQHSYQCSSRSKGSLACTPKPPSFLYPASISPPSIATRSRMPTRPWPVTAPLAVCAATPRPLSLTSTSTSCSPYLIVTLARAGPACWSVFRSASWTILKADRSTPDSSRRFSPSIVRSTSRPASRARSTSQSSSSTLGCGASASGSSGSLPSIPTMRRISFSAARPVCSTEPSASFAFDASWSIILRAAAACTTMTLTLWATTSCSSRAIRARSCATAS